MDILHFLGMVVYAAESIISPLPDDRFLTPIIPTTTQAVPTPTTPMSLYDIAMTYVATPLPPPEPTPSITTRTARKKSFTISLLGDSMIDTLGASGGGLDKMLQTIYPSTTFTILNHGVGAANIDSGVERLTNPYTYLGVEKPSVLSQKSDIIVVESFAYNPYGSDGNIAKHTRQLGVIIDTIRANLPATKVVIAATIGPNTLTFADAAPDVIMTYDEKIARLDTIRAYLKNTIAFAQANRIPLANAYQASIDAGGSGKMEYISPADNIHYSWKGEALMAQTLADTIVTNRLLE